MDSGSSITLNPSSHAVFETIYAVKRGSVVALMNTASYFGISEMFSLKQEIVIHVPTSSAVCLNF